MTSQRTETPGRVDALSALLDTERRLAAELETTAREAEAIVGAAETEAKARLDALDGELSAEGEAFARSIEAGAANRIEALRRAADAAVARYRSVTDETVLELARDAVSVVVAGDDQEST